MVASRPVSAPLALLALLAGCTASPPAPHPQPIQAEGPQASATTPAPPPSPAAQALPSSSSWKQAARPDTPEDLLSSFAVDSRKPARRTLYSWTTEEQARELAKTKTLLLKGKTEAGYASPFEQRLQSTSGMPVAERLRAMLTRPPFTRQRYAFANPIGWAVGVEGKPYGPVLLQIQLRKEAIVLTFDGDSGTDLWPLAAHTASGEPVTAQQIEKNPERVAAFFNLQQDSRGIWFREYIVLNEGMVESWSMGTDAIKGEVERARSALARLEKISPEEDLSPPAEFVALWRGETEGSPVSWWAKTVGVASPSYVMVRKNVAAITGQLTRAVHPPPLEVTPPAAKPRKLPPAPPPPPAPPVPPKIWAV